MTNLPAEWIDDLQTRTNQLLFGKVGDKLAIADVRDEVVPRAEDVWRKTGGEMVTLPPAEAKRYIDLVTPVVTSLLSANPRIKEDYEALLAAAVKYRQ